MKDTSTFYSNSHVSMSFDFISNISRKKIADKILTYTKLPTTYSDSTIKSNLNKGSIRVVMNEVGGSSMSQIQVGFLPLSESVNVMFKVLDLIDSVGFTTSTCGVQFSIAFDSKALGIPDMHNVNTLKLVSDIDDVLLSTSRKRDIDPLSSSLVYIYPDNMFPKCASINAHDLKSYKFPSSRLFSVDFDSIKDGYVSLRLPRNKDYHKNKRGLYDQLIKITRSVYGVLVSGNKLSVNDITKTNRMAERFNNILKSIVSIDTFVANYPDIILTVDLKDDVQLLKQYFPFMREKLFELISYCSMESASVNYDIDRGKLQVKDAVLFNCQYISGVEFFYSRINGELHDCIFYECMLSDSVIKSCEFMYGTEVKKSIILDTYFHGMQITLKNCYVNNQPDMLVEADLYGTVVRGVVGYNCNVDEKTEILK